VAKPGRRRSTEHKLTRLAFTVSRLTEFCSEKELVNQTGHDVENWPLVMLKELFDNALDASEESEVAPEIEISVAKDGTITVTDNANGIAAETIKAILDYTIRVSSREAYVSPTRGAQGNALKTILAMSYVLDRESDFREAVNDEAVGITLIETRGELHRIEFKVDHVNSQPKLNHTVTPCTFRRGTRITVKWPTGRKQHRKNSLLLSERPFKQLAEAYVWFNPHLTLRGVWHGKEFINVKATNPNWEKWRPCNPTSAHWYNEDRLQHYMAAHVARDRDLKRERSVRDFLPEFRGLSGTIVRRKIITEVGCSHCAASHSR